MIVTNYKKSLRGSGEAGKTTQQITHSSKVSHAQGKCYHGYYIVHQQQWVNTDTNNAEVYAPSMQIPLLVTINKVYSIQQRNRTMLCITYYTCIHMVSHEFFAAI